MLHSEVGVCIGKTCPSFTKVYKGILNYKLQFIDDCGDLYIVLCVRSFRYISESIISACAIILLFGGLRFITIIIRMPNTPIKL